MGLGNPNYRRKRKQPEQELQKSIVGYLDVALPKDAFYFAVPNGGYRTPTEAAALKGVGVKPGVPDLMIVYRGWAYGIETKTDKVVGHSKRTETSAAQDLVHMQMARAGVHVCVCRSMEEVQAALIGWSIPLHAKVGEWIQVRPLKARAA